MNFPVLISASQNQQSSDTPHLRRTGRKRNPRPEYDNDRVRKKARNGEITIDFDEVYQDGNAEYKHAIIEHPKGSGKWYILRCDEHGLHFGSRPLQGAMKHLHGKAHSNLPKDGTVAIRTLGIRVRNCDAQDAESNNTAFKNALADGYEPFRAGDLPTSGPDQLRQPETGEEPGRVPDETSHDPRTNTPRKREAFEGITHPVAGELYRVWYDPRNAYFAVLMLPTGSFSSVGMGGSIADTALLDRHIPTCYLSDKQERRIDGWADNHKDGGHLVHQRKFPVMYLDGLSVPRVGEFEIPDGALFSWVPAKDLRPFSFDDPECQSVHGFGAAQDFCERMKAIHGNMARAEGPGMVPKEPTSLCSPDADEAVMNSGRVFQC